ncbi:Multidrug export protein EmrA [Usitatibacter rugosus]|uniref:Multidrug export protein EmrA n=1 Tax=Usitatibacter rugosus TaxID=2732067 RepID=A0A6M4GT53_9PROT|nr:efflux RND transporter periplasmic adaptor subunit [Usitatibacter rugosus]QJR10510.1 Multidrug export protein EmrA [Usitatibacter rugosus]
MNRKKLLLAVIGAFVIGAGAYGAYWSTHLRNTETTDNAYVNGNVVQITSQVPGTVVSIAADDTDFVKAGTTLVQLDTADSKVALDEAESQLAMTVRQVRNLYATSGQLSANVSQRTAELSRAQDDLKRREDLAASGFISKEALQHERTTLQAADAAATAAKQQLAAHRALVDNTTIENHPDVRNAAAKVREAYLAYSRTALAAPVSGYVAKRGVQLGQRVAPGAPLMAVVPLDDVWVDANFKEGQLKSMRVGQPVTLSADLYGNKLEYHGKVMGFGAGTGGAFALLPAQNASGNWIKIVQRVPVRIALDRNELAKHPLQVGLSMEAKVDTHDQGGERLPAVARNSNVTHGFAAPDTVADDLVKAIIANDGRSAPATASVAAPGVATVTTTRVAAAKLR